jgi:predicted DNA-binding transcriptional regulator AlpA
MGRRIDVDNLVGVTEIATRLGASSAARVHDWRRRYADFPKPVTQLAMGLVWSWPEVERWAKQTGRLPKPKGR